MDANEDDPSVAVGGPRGSDVAGLGIPREHGVAAGPVPGASSRPGEALDGDAVLEVGPAVPDGLAPGVAGRVGLEGPVDLDEGVGVVGHLRAALVDLAVDVGAGREDPEARREAGEEGPEADAHVAAAPGDEVADRGGRVLDFRPGAV